MSFNQLQNLYHENAEGIIDHYRELVNQTRTTLFPLWTFTWIEEPNLEGMSHSQVHLAEALAPYLPLDFRLSFGWKRSLFYFLWFILFLLWMGLFIGWLNSLEPSNVASPQPQPTPLNLLIRILLVIFFILPPVLLYGYTIWFLTTRRNSWKTKALWLVSLLAFLFYLYSQLQNVRPAETNAILASALFFDFILFFLLIPSVLYVVYNFLYYGKFFVELIANALNGFVYAHQPVSFQILRKLVTNPIKSENTNWHLSERSQIEISTFKELAVSNLDATEKKTIPTVILIGVFGFLATLPAFQQFFANAIQESLSWILEVLTGNVISITFGRMVFGFAAVILIILTLAANIALVQNLFVQGIIVQACTIAEYTQKQTVLMTSQKKQASSFFESILKGIIGLLTLIFGSKDTKY